MSSYDFEWLSNNLFVAYPFATPAPKVPLIAAGSSSSSSSSSSAVPHAPVDLGEIFADGVVYTSDMFGERMKLVELGMTFNWPDVPTDGYCRLQFEGGFELILDHANPEVTFRAELYGRWMVVEWVLVDTNPLAIPNIGSKSVRDVVCRFLLAAEPLQALDHLDIDLSEEDAWLESSLIHTGPDRVRRVFLKIGQYLFQLNDTVRLEPGFNVDLTYRQPGDPDYTPPDDDAVRQTKTILVDAIPGAGKGRYLRCVPDPFIRTVNNVGPDERGNLEMDPRDCYWLDRPVTSGPSPAPPDSQVQEVATVKPLSLKLRNACEECCPCSEYVSTYENLRSVWTDAQLVAARYDQILADYLSLRQTLVDLGAGDDPSIKTVVRSRAGFVVDVSFLFINGSDPLEADTRIIFKILLAMTPDIFDLEYVEGSGIFSAPGGYSNQALDPDGDDKEWTLEFTDMNIPIGGAINWTGSFRVKPGAEDRANAKFTAEVTLYVDGEELGSAGAAARLKRPEQLS